MIDTSALVALADQSDQFHVVAKAFTRTITSVTRLYTSNYILDEIVTRLRFMVGVVVAGG